MGTLLGAMHGCVLQCMGVFSQLIGLRKVAECSASDRVPLCCLDVESLLDHVQLGSDHRSPKLAVREVAPGGSAVHSTYVIRGSCINRPVLLLVAAYMHEMMSAYVLVGRIIPSYNL